MTFTLSCNAHPGALTFMIKCTVLHDELARGTQRILTGDIHVLEASDAGCGGMLETQATVES